MGKIPSHIIYQRIKVFQVLIHFGLFPLALIEFWRNETPVETPPEIYF